MTYCLAIATDTGLVFCSDTRTNAGPDVLSSHSKMHIYDIDENRIIVLLSAGNLATTQSIINQIDADLLSADCDSLKTCDKMTDIAKYLGRVSREQQKQAKESTGNSALDVSVSLIVGGQIRGTAATIYMIYSAGNHISVSGNTPYLQIGESKYGKPILDRILCPGTSLEDAARCALVSMDSTIRANATVGPPLEVLVYENNTFEADHYIKLTEDDPYLLELRRAWGEVVLAGFKELPLFEWEKRSSPTLHAISNEQTI